MKRCVSIILAAFVMLTIVSGCGNGQRMPDAETEHYELDIDYVQAGDSNDLRSILGAPEQIYETQIVGKTSIAFDAVIEVPDVNAVPVIEISLRNISDENITAFNSAVFGDMPYYQSDDIENSRWERLYFCTEQEFHLSTGNIDPFSEVSVTRRKDSMVNSDIKYHRNHNPETEPFVFNSANIDTPLMENGWAPNTSLAPEEALEQAKQVIAHFAPEFDCVCYAASPSYKLDSTEYGKLYGYSFHFTRSYAGIPTVYTLWDCAEMDKNSDFRCQSYEGVQVVVSEYGIEYVWYAPSYEVIGILEDNAELLTFDNIMDIALAMLDIKYADNILVDRITFGYIRVQMREDPSRYIMIPVWDFFGVSDLTSESEPYQYNSLLTVNAMDGTIINRSWGQ